MNKRLLYIEDDAIDVIAIRRQRLDVHICSSFKELKMNDLSTFDHVLCDSNLPDASYLDLKEYLKDFPVRFISGSAIPGEDVWVKPIEYHHLVEFLFDSFHVNLKYINSLAEGDMAYQKEMLDTAIDILPKRWAALDANRTEMSLLKLAAHKTLSSFRVCGIDPTSLHHLYDLTEKTSINDAQISHILVVIEKQISHAVTQLKRELNA